MLNFQGKILEAPVKSEKKALIVFLHGWGADSSSLLDLGHAFQAGVPEAKCYFPNGPRPCEMNPYGHAWFRLYKSSGERLPNEVLQKKAESAASDVAYWIIDVQKNEKILPERTFLVGFSQGAMLSLYAGLSYPKLVKGVVSYSGGLLGKSMWLNPDPFTCYAIIHGDADTVVPVNELHFASQVLGTYKLNHKNIVVKKLEHSINQEGFIKGLEFIQRELVR